LILNNNNLIFIIHANFVFVRRVGNALLPI
jgi:hypothetical protein